MNAYRAEKRKTRPASGDAVCMSQYRVRFEFVWVCYGSCLLLANNKSNAQERTWGPTSNSLISSRKLANSSFQKRLEIDKTWQWKRPHEHGSMHRAYKTIMTVNPTNSQKKIQNIIQHTVNKAFYNISCTVPIDVPEIKNKAYSKHCTINKGHCVFLRQNTWRPTITTWKVNIRKSNIWWNEWPSQISLCTEKFKFHVIVPTLFPNINCSSPSMLHMLQEVLLQILKEFSVALLRLCTWKQHRWWDGEPIFFDIGKSMITPHNDFDRVGHLRFISYGILTSLSR